MLFSGVTMLRLLQDSRIDNFDQRISDDLQVGAACWEPPHPIPLAFAERRRDWIRLSLWEHFKPGECTVESDWYSVPVVLRLQVTPRNSDHIVIKAFVPQFVVVGICQRISRLHRIDCWHRFLR